MSFVNDFIIQINFGIATIYYAFIRRMTDNSASRVMASIQRE